MPTDGAQPSVPPPPYATGGGGTVLEHRYGAVLLGHLLTAEPVPGLGDDATPVSVRFQAGAFSPVDDLLVVGRTPDGEERRLSIGVRRAPSFVSSEKTSTHLLSSYLRVVTEHWDELLGGRWRLGLGVASPNAAVRQVGELSMIAKGTTDGAAFRVEVQRPGRTNAGVRDRLVHLDALVQAACDEGGIRRDAEVDDLTWRLLSALHMVELRLEGSDETDRTAAVSRLRTVTRDGTTAAADRLFARLAELTGRYAPTGAAVTEPLLRRDLSGMPLTRPSVMTSGLILDVLSYLSAVIERAAALPPHLRHGVREQDHSDLLDRVHQSVRVSSEPLRAPVFNPLDDPASLRAEVLVQIQGARVMGWEQADRESGAANVVVLGDPGYGKSHLLARQARLAAQAAQRRLLASARVSEVPLVIHVTCAEWAEALRSKSFEPSTVGEEVREALLEAALAPLPPRSSGSEVRVLLAKRLGLGLPDWPGSVSLPSLAPLTVLADSLDEAPSERLVKALQVLAADPGVRVIVSSRPTDPRVGMLDLGPRGMTFELLGFGEEELTEFVQAFFSGSPEGAAALLERLRDPRLRSLARVPLLASFCCVIFASHEPGQPFPVRRAGLYEAVLARMVAAEHRARDREEDEELVQAKLELLSYLALSFAPDSKNRRRFSFRQLTEALQRYRPDALAELEEAARERHLLLDPGRKVLPRSGPYRHLRWELVQADGLIVRSGVGVGATLEFFHQSVHEYLTARHLAASPEDLRLREIWEHRWFEPFWEEAAVLTTGRLVELERVEEARAVIERLRSEPHDAYFEILRLSGRCLAEAGESEWIQSIVPRIVQHLLMVLRLDVGQYSDKVASVLAEFPSGRSVLTRLLGALEQEDSDVGWAVAKALEDATDAETLRSLRQLLQSDVSSVRARAADALRGTTDPGALRLLIGLLGGDDEDVSHHAAMALEGATSVEVIRTLRDLLRSENPKIRHRAAEALTGTRDFEALQALVALLEDDDFGVREFGAARAIVGVDNPKILQAMLSLLELGTPEARSAAAAALHEIRDAGAIQALGRLAAHPDQAVRENVPWALAPADPISVAALLADPDPSVRERAARALYGTTESVAVRGLTRLLHDQDAEIRRTAAIALRGTASSEAIEGLLSLLSDREGNVRRAAVHSLDPYRFDPRRLGDPIPRLTDPHVVDRVAMLHRDPDLSVRGAVVSTLAGSSDPNAVETLIAMFKDEDEGVGESFVSAVEVRAAATRALEGCTDRGALEALVDLLSSDIEELRRAAEDTLTATSDPAVTSFLADLLGQEHFVVRAAEASAMASSLSISSDGTWKRLAGLWEEGFSPRWLLGVLRRSTRMAPPLLGTEAWEGARAKLSVLTWLSLEEAVSLRPDLNEDFLQLVRLAVQRNPEAPELHNILGGALLQLEDRHGAIDAFLQAAGFAEQQGRHQLKASYLYRAFNISWDLGIHDATLVSRIRRSHPTFHLLPVLDAELSLDGGRPEVALNHLDKIEGTRLPARARFLRGLALLWLGRTELARAEYEQGKRVADRPFLLRSAVLALERYRELIHRPAAIADLLGLLQS